MKKILTITLSCLSVISNCFSQEIPDVIPFELSAKSIEEGLVIEWKEVEGLLVDSYRLEKLDEEWNYELVQEIPFGINEVLDIEADNGENFYRLVAKLRSGKKAFSNLFIADHFESNQGFVTNELEFKTPIMEEISKSKLFTVDLMNPLMIITRIKLTHQSLLVDNLISSNMDTSQEE